MRKLTTLILLTLVLVGCGTAGNRFKVEGRILNMNQGEFYVYSLDGSVNGIDTVRVDGGRLAYETVCERPTTLIMVFPNFSEQPIFAEPGKTVKLSADASHLKELEVTGTDENKLMNKFRKQIAAASPPEVAKYAEQFVLDHPESAVSVYITRKYFIATAQPDYKKAVKLLKAMRQAQPKNGMLAQYERQLALLGKIRKGKPLPAFSVKDIYGKTVTNASLKGHTAVVTVWATWNYDSQSFQRRLQDLYRRANGKLKIVSICLDPSVTQCKRNMERDSVKWSVICDGNMLETPVLQTLGLHEIPDNILLQDGLVVDKGMKIKDLQKRIESLI